MTQIQIGVEGMERQRIAAREDGGQMAAAQAVTQKTTEERLPSSIQRIFLCKSDIGKTEMKLC